MKMKVKAQKSVKQIKEGEVYEVAGVYEHTSGSYYQVELDNSIFLYLVENFVIIEGDEDDTED